MRQVRVVLIFSFRTTLISLSLQRRPPSPCSSSSKSSSCPSPSCSRSLRPSPSCLDSSCLRPCSPKPSSFSHLDHVEPLSQSPPLPRLKIVMNMFSHLVGQSVEPSSLSYLIHCGAKLLKPSSSQESCEADCESRDHESHKLWETVPK